MCIKINSYCSVAIIYTLVILCSGQTWLNNSETPTPQTLQYGDPGNSSAESLLGQGHDMDTKQFSKYVSKGGLDITTNYYPEQVLEAPQCGHGSWIPLYINDSDSLLYLEACLKFIILDNHFNKYSGSVVDTSTFRYIWSTSKYRLDKIILLDVTMNYDKNGQSWFVHLEIRKTTGSYYWSRLIFSYFNKYRAHIALTNNLRRYETKLNGSYNCQLDDTIMLVGDNASIVVRGLKYRAFRETGPIFPDNAITHCPSVFWEFLGIVAFVGVHIFVTIVTIIWKCVKQLRKYDGKRDGYREFGSRFEP